MNKQKKSSYNKTYYLKHRLNILKHLSQKIKCRCGASVARSNLTNHLKTTKHKKRMESLKQNETPVVQSQ